MRWALFIQLIGLLAWLILLISFRQKTEKKILFIQAIADFVYTLHYIFLGAVSGAIVAGVCLSRDIVYYKAKNRLYAYYFYLSFYIIMILWNIIVVRDIYMTFPFIATSITGYAFTLKRKEIVMGSLMASALWIWYNLLVYSIVGIFTESLLVISNITVLLAILVAEKKLKQVNENENTLITS